MTSTDPIDAILEAPPCPASEAHANTERLRRRNLLVTANLGLAYHHARRLTGLGVDRDDLVQAGALGLMRAAELYRAELGPFAPYATRWIRAVMNRAIDVARGRHERGLGDDDDGDDNAPRDPADPGTVEPPDALASAEVAQTIRSALERLPARQRGLVEERFGLDGAGGSSRGELAARMGISRERVRQIENTALARLAEMLGIRGAAGV